LSRPLQVIGGRRWWRQPATVAVIAFALGAVSTFAAMALLLNRDAPEVEPLVPAALSAADPAPVRQPLVQTAAAAAPAASAPEPVQAAGTSIGSAAVVSTVAAAGGTSVPDVQPATLAAPEPAPATIELVAVPPTAVSAPGATPDPVAAAVVAPPADDAVVARVARIREIQTLLAALGYVPGRADGDAGPQTLTAAALFSAERGLQDANLDAAMLAALRAARAGALPVRPTGAGSETVLERVTRVREIQAVLIAAGYELGRPDGDAGPVTIQAAAAYAAERGLADANLDAALLAFMREGAAG
jgi:peptidoglycan hydrolase-like protein with peptidoglycan-binding domain